MTVELRSKILLFAKCIVLAFSINLSAQPYQQDKAGLVNQLFVLQKNEAKAGDMVKSMIGMIKKQKPAVPESYWQQLSGQINLKPFIEDLKRVYQKHYSVEQLQKLNGYYQQPRGEPPVKPSQQMEAEIYQLSSQFGKQTGQFISQKFKQDGY